MKVAILALCASAAAFVPRAPVSVARVSRAGTTAPTMLLGRKTVGAQARRVNQVVRKMADAAAETGGLQGAIATYEGWCKDAPLLTKGCTSMIGFLLGDVMAQLLIEKVAYNWYRTFRLATFGLLVHGTTGHWFYGKLDNAIPGKGGAAVATKVFIDQVLWNPIFGIMFFGYMDIMQNMGIGGTIAEIKSKLLSQVTGSWTVWPIAHTINFRFIPTDVRILYINTIQIFYNCFLSILSAAAK